MVLGVRTSGRTVPSELFARLPSSPQQTTASRPIRLAIPTHRTRRQVCMLLTWFIPPSLSCPETAVPNPTSDGKRCRGVSFRRLTIGVLRGFSCGCKFPPSYFKPRTSYTVSMASSRVRAGPSCLQWSGTVMSGQNVLVRVERTLTKSMRVAGRLHDISERNRMLCGEFLARLEFWRKHCFSIGVMHKFSGYRSPSRVHCLSMSR